MSFETYYNKTYKGNNEEFKKHIKNAYNAGHLEDVECHQAIVAAARFLIKVKKYRNTVGKDIWYIASKPIAWANLFLSIDALDKPEKINAIPQKFDSDIASGLAKGISKGEDND